MLPSSSGVNYFFKHFPGCSEFLNNRLQEIRNKKEEPVENKSEFKQKLKQYGADGCYLTLILILLIGTLISLFLKNGPEFLTVSTAIKNEMLVQTPSSFKQGGVLTKESIAESIVNTLDLFFLNTDGSETNFLKTHYFASSLRLSFYKTKVKPCNFEQVDGKCYETIFDDNTADKDFYYFYFTDLEYEDNSNLFEEIDAMNENELKAHYFTLNKDINSRNNYITDKNKLLEVTSTFFAEFDTYLGNSSEAQANKRNISIPGRNTTYIGTGYNVLVSPQFMKSSYNQFKYAKVSS